MTPNFLARALRRSMRGSPPDEALLADEQVVDDYYRAVRMFATGRLAGYVREQSALAQDQAGNYPVDGRGWAGLLGEYDTLFAPETTLAYLGHQLHAAEFERVPNQGRLLAYAVTKLTAERLRDRKQR